MSNTKDIENYREFVFPPDSKGIFNFKQIWGYNDAGKLEQIKPIAEDPVKAPYFDFDFFFNSTDLGHLLIYGLSFQQAGYAVEMAEAFPKYSKPQHGCVIDGHILIRLSALQKINCLSHITFAYYSDADQKRYQDLVDLYQLKNVSYLPSANFNFKI